MSFVVARLMRYDACVITGATLRFAANSARSASVYGLFTHWFEFLAQMAIADASIAAARSNAVGSPPLVEMCAPRRSPGASGKEKRVMADVSFRAAKTARNPAATERSLPRCTGSLALFGARDDTERVTAA